MLEARQHGMRRRPDPFAEVTSELRGWFEAEPWHTSRELLERLQAQCREAAHRMVFGTMTADAGMAPGTARAG
jgi:hypothetical protein